MVQEIITYLIIALALFFTFLRIRKKFWKKKKAKKTAVKKEDYIYQQHNCSDCSAECILRDVNSSVLQSNGDLCKKIETASSD